MRAILWITGLVLLGLVGTALKAEQNTDAEAVKLVVSEIRTLLQGETPESKIGALDWLMRDAKVRDESLAELIIPLLQDPNQEVRVRAVRNLRWLAEKGNQPSKDALLKALSGEDKAARIEALNQLRGLAQADSLLHREPAIVQLLPGLIKHPDADTAVAAIGVMRASPTLKSHPDLLTACGDAVQSGDPRLRNAASEALIEFIRLLDEQRNRTLETLSKAAENDPALKDRVAALKPASGSGGQATGAQPLLFAIPANAPDLTFFAAFVQPLFTKSLEAAGGKNCLGCHAGPNPVAPRYHLQPPDSDGRFSLQATLMNYQATLETVNLSQPMESNLLKKVTQPHGGIQAIWADANSMGQQSLTAWLQGEKAIASLQALLDFEYFAQNIQPLLYKRGEDQMGCVDCHTTHAVFNLKPRSPGGSTLADARYNYANALKVVEVDKPLESLLLKKPISGRQITPETGLTHAGGIRWPGGRDSAEWKTFYAWIQMRTLK